MVQLFDDNRIKLLEHHNEMMKMMIYRNTDPQKMKDLMPIIRKYISTKTLIKTPSEERVFLISELAKRIDQIYCHEMSKPNYYFRLYTEIPKNQKIIFQTPRLVLAKNPRNKFELQMSKPNNNLDRIFELMTNKVRSILKNNKKEFDEEMNRNNYRLHLTNFSRTKFKPNKCPTSIGIYDTTQKKITFEQLYSTFEGILILEFSHLYSPKESDVYTTETVITLIPIFLVRQIKVCKVLSLFDKNRFSIVKDD